MRNEYDIGFSLFFQTCCQYVRCAVLLINVPWTLLCVCGPASRPFWVGPLDQPQNGILLAAKRRYWLESSKQSLMSRTNVSNIDSVA